MSRTQGAVYGDTAHQGGLVWLDAGLLGFSSNFTRTRNGLGDVSLNMGASVSGQVWFGLGQLKRLVEVSTSDMPFQERFGTAAGTAGYPAGAPGLPPFAGASQLTPATGQPSKGLKILNVVVSYLITGAATTTNTIGISRVVFANNVANSVTAVLAATALSSATNANPYLTTTAVSASFENTDNSDILVELNVTTQAAGAYRCYGIGLHVDFNYT